ncbi:MAG TPA: glycogen synthase GlgA [Candidatus Brocadiia bacterium]|nr:glycogen synthase GlgA [Candidatus Brocadiia bacterium]
MKIVQIASEVAPLAKTGGLADVAGSLSTALAGLGIETTVFMPQYRTVIEKCEEVVPVMMEPLKLKLGNQAREARLVRTSLPGTDVRVYLVRSDPFFYRDGYYVDPTSGRDYGDNCERFAFFCQAALSAVEALDLEPDIIHSHDWQTGLVPLYLKTLHAGRAGLGRGKSVFTIHNMAYQGKFPQECMDFLGVGREYYNWKQLESYGELCLLKGGLVFADGLTTVSPTYARQIQTQEFGRGLDGVMRERSGDLRGIINGLDDAEWNPDGDPHLPARFSARNLSGKRKCKERLQKEMALFPSAGTPIIGMVGRMVEQKGFDLLLQCVDDLMTMDLQLVVLGGGDERWLADAFAAKANSFRGRFSFYYGFDEGFAHRIYAGSDALLVPSRFEPCGLTQLCAMRYATIPIVHRTGGLADTVTDYSPELLTAGKCNGFCFDGFDKSAFLGAVRRALDIYKDSRSWQRMAEICATKDVSWNRSATEYKALYEELLKR